jgi:hypothetical protein
MFNEIEIPEALQNDEVFIGLFKKFKFTKEIEINFCISDAIIEALIKTFLFLERLILREITNENKFIKLIENYCERLKYVDIRDLFFKENDSVSDFFITLPDDKFIVKEENEVDLNTRFKKFY